MTSTLALRRLRRLFTAFRSTPPLRELFATQARAPAEAALIIRIFYVCLFFMVLEQHATWTELARAESLPLLWPVRWLEWTGAPWGVPVLVAEALVGTLLAAVFPNVRVFRVLAAIGAWEAGALWNSVGGHVMSHGWHAWLWVAVVFVLLPSLPPVPAEATRRRRELHLRVLWAAQATVLLFYSLSGAFKLAGAILQATHGQAHAFSVDALARHAAARFLEPAAGAPSGLGLWLIDHPHFGWLPFVLALYLEVFSFLVAFRPSLHRPWAVGLILMHVGIYLTLGVLFSWQILLLGLLLLGSPFAPRRVTVRAVLAELPLAGDLLAWRRRWLAGRRPSARRAPVVVATIPGQAPRA